MKSLSKMLSLSMGLVLVFFSTALASPCVSGDSLSSYIGLSSDGCTTGGATFSGFSVRDDLLQTGASLVDPTLITVNTVDDIANPGLQFVVNLAAQPGDLLEALIGFGVSGNFISGATLTMEDASASGDAAVTVVEDIFPLTLITFATAADTTTLASLGFPPASSIDVVVDITADGGFNDPGNSSLGSATTRFQTAAPVPEPSTLLALVTGLGGIIGFYRSRKVNNAS